MKLTAVAFTPCKLAWDPTRGSSVEVEVEPVWNPQMLGNFKLHAVAHQYISCRTSDDLNQVVQYGHVLASLACFLRLQAVLRGVNLCIWMGNWSCWCS